METKEQEKMSQCLFDKGISELNEEEKKELNIKIVRWDNEEAE